ncbi:DUF7507 domain-containing protein [Curtobacterium sp. L1-20]|uniref:DUF7507 domain-containing protein n=1 Tax=Curtobacterium sp. L1-20 TaxID=3138181 RepID=UPI003B51E006
MTRKLVFDLTGRRRYIAYAALIALLGALLSAVTLLRPANPASAATSPSQQWATSLTAPSSTDSVTGATRTFQFGTTGITATETTTAVSGSCYMTSSLSSWSGTNANSFVSPTPPATTGVATSVCLGDAGPSTRTSTLTFSRPIIAPMLHVMNLDASQLRVAGTSTTGAAITVAPLTRNTTMEVTGNTLNSTFNTAINAGCQANDGSNPNGACGSFRLTAASGLVQSVTLTNTTANSGLPQGTQTSDDGWNYTLSYPTTPLTKAFSPSTIAPGQTAQLTFTIANPANEAQPTLSPLGFTDTLPAGVTIANGTVTNNGSCGSPTLTGAGGAALTAGSTSVTADTITVAAGATCTITVNVTATTAGSYTNNNANLSTTVANLVPNANTTLTVAVPPSTLTLRKNVVARNAPTDQFNLTIGTPTPTTATTSGTATGVQAATAGPATVNPGQTYSISESGTTGTDLSRYSSSYVCTSAGATIASGSGTTGSVTIPSAGTTGANVTCTFTNTPFNPSLTIAKTATPTTITAAGQTVTYRFEVTNTGDVPLTNVTINDTAFSGTGTAPTITCPAGTASMAPGATVTCTASYTATQADVNAGRITNTATATGTPPTGAPITSTPSTAVVTATQSPGISVVKSASPSDAASFTVGQDVTYSFVVTNTGNVTLTGVAVDDSEFTGSGQLSAIDCPTTTLAPGAQTTCTATYTITQADVDRGSIRNVATATGVPPTGTPPVSPPSEVTIPSNPAPSLSVVKTADRTTITAAGQTVNYSFVVTNTGNVTITDPVVDDSDFTGTGTAPVVDCPAGSIAPGASVTCTASYVTTQADVDQGGVTNTATVTGTPPGGGTTPPSPPSTVTVPSDPAPALTVVKTADRTELTAAGQTITYSFVVTNTGNVTLTDVAVDDTDFTGTGTLSAVTCPTATLAPGADITCTATYEVTQADIDNGGVTNTAVGTGTPPTGDPIPTPPSTVSVPSTQAPSLSVVKTADRTTITAAGQTVNYSFVVTNTGNVTITDPVVDDSDFTGTGTAPVVDCPAGSIAPGASVTCTASYVTTQADVDQGGVTNTATVTGTPPGGGTTPPSPPSTVTVPSDPAPALTVVKTADRTELTAAGQTITYSFVVTNTGNVTLTDVAVDDTDFTGTGTLSAVTCPTATLAPGADITCTATYEVTQADIDNGGVTNTAVGTGTPPTGDPIPTPPSTVSVPSTQSPGISVVKSASPSDAASFTVGQDVTYSFVVTNTGNVTLTGVAVDDSEFTGSGQLSAIDCPTTTLAPGAQTTCTATYTITQADVDRGSIRNVATATGVPPTGTPPVSPPSEVTIPSNPAPSLSVVKTADRTTITAAGQTVNYSFVVTNTGNVTITDPVVDDSDFTGTGTAPVVDCPAGSIAPGASVTCTASYVTTQADVDQGGVTNTATVTGTPPGGGTTPPSPPSTVTVPSDPAPALTVVKTATPETVGKVGDTVKYSFRITNTGNVTLRNVTVNEGAFTGTGDLSAITCPAGAAALAPEASVTCTATYALTQADVDAGEVTNTATATGTPPTGTPVDSPPSTTTVTVPEDPSLEIVKTANTETIIRAGQSITYSFAVTNTGNVTMSDIVIDDRDFSGTGELSSIDCPAELVAPGATLTCTATYVVTQADVDSGELTNAATVTGTTPGGNTPDPTPPSTVEIPVTKTPGISVVKSADVTGEEDFVAGNTVTYSFVATNTGNVTLTDVVINDTDFSGTGELSAIDCPADQTASLAPGASVTCTATYTLTQGDINAGEVTNTATASGVPPAGTPLTSTPSSAVVPTPENPSLSLVKTSDRQTISAAGQKVTYSFLVTNTGNVTITNPTINDTGFSGTGELSAVTCPSSGDRLLPGQSVTCTATYTTTQADVDAGSLRNTATAVGTTPGGDPTDPTPPSTTIVPTDPHPALTVVKKASSSTITGAGQTVRYTFTVTNTGNVTMRNVTVIDRDFSGTGQLSAITCPAGTTALAPQMSVTCTASYVSTAADVRAGTLTNTADVTGTPATGGDPITSTPSVATVAVVAGAAGLAFTGATIGWPLGIAALLLVTGLGLITLRKRRRV